METVLVEDVAERAHQSKIATSASLPLARESHSNGMPSSRHLRASASRELVYEFSNAPELLMQYYQLRTRMFIREWDLHAFSGEQDQFDTVSDILIVRQKNLVVAGGRMLISTPETRRSLPMEDAEFDLQQALPELELHDKRYAECGRFAALPDFRSRELSCEMWSKFLHHAIRNKLDYTFWIAPVLQARNNRQIAQMLDLPCTIRQEVKVPDREEYEGLKMYLGVVDLTKFSRGESASSRNEVREAVEA